MENSIQKTKNKKVIIILIWILILGWMLLIFLLSSQPAKQSADLSGGILSRITKIIIPDFSNLSIEEQKTKYEFTHNVLRKIAHFFIYMVLGILCVTELLLYNTKIKLKIMISFGMVFIYAISDEIHQLFVDGRSGEIKDVCIDSAGGVLGISLVLVMVYIKKTYTKKRIDKVTTL